MDILCFFRAITTVGIACFTSVGSIFSTLDCWHWWIPRFVYCFLLTCLPNYWHSDIEICIKFQLILTWTFFLSWHVGSRFCLWPNILVLLTEMTEIWSWTDVSSRGNKKKIPCLPTAIFWIYTPFLQPLTSTLTKCTATNRCQEWVEVFK